jgi:hypothetical protein
LRKGDRHECRDILIGSATNEQVKFGSDVYIFSASSAVFDINSADPIVDFDVVDDQIGLTDCITHIQLTEALQNTQHGVQIVPRIEHRKPARKSVLRCFPLN